MGCWWFQWNRLRSGLEGEKFNESQLDFPRCMHAHDWIYKWFVTQFVIPSFCLAFDLSASQFLFSNDLHVIASSDNKEILSVLIYRFPFLMHVLYQGRQRMNYSFIFNHKLVLSVGFLTVIFHHNFIKIHSVTETTCLHTDVYNLCVCVYACLIGHWLLNWL